MTDTIKNILDQIAPLQSRSELTHNLTIIINPEKKKDDDAIKKQQDAAIRKQQEESERKAKEEADLKAKQEQEKKVKEATQKQEETKLTQDRIKNEIEGIMKLFKNEKNRPSLFIGQKSLSESWTNKPDDVKRKYAEIFKTHVLIDKGNAKSIADYGNYYIELLKTIKGYDTNQELFKEAFSEIESFKNTHKWYKIDKNGNLVCNASEPISGQTGFDEFKDCFKALKAAAKPAAKPAPSQAVLEKSEQDVANEIKEIMDKFNAGKNTTEITNPDSKFGDLYYQDPVDTKYYANTIANYGDYFIKLLKKNPNYTKYPNLFSSHEIDINQYMNTYKWVNVGKDGRKCLAHKPHPNQVPYDIYENCMNPGPTAVMATKPADGKQEMIREKIKKRMDRFAKSNKTLFIGEKSYGTKLEEDLRKKGITLSPDQKKIYDDLHSKHIYTKDNKPTGFAKSIRDFGDYYLGMLHAIPGYDTNKNLFTEAEAIINTFKTTARWYIDDDKCVVALPSSRPGESQFDERTACLKAKPKVAKPAHPSAKQAVAKSTSKWGVEKTQVELKPEEEAEIKNIITTLIENWSPLLRDMANEYKYYKSFVFNRDTLNKIRNNAFECENLIAKNNKFEKDHMYHIQDILCRNIASYLTVIQNLQPILNKIHLGQELSLDEFNTVTEYKTLWENILQNKFTKMIIDKINESFNYINNINNQILYVMISTPNKEQRTIPDEKTRREKQIITYKYNKTDTDRFNIKFNYDNSKIKAIKTGESELQESTVKPELHQESTVKPAVKIIEQPKLQLKRNTKEDLYGSIPEIIKTGMEDLHDQYKKLTSSNLEETKQNQVLAVILNAIKTSLSKNYTYYENGTRKQMNVYELTNLNKQDIESILGTSDVSIPEYKINNDKAKINRLFEILVNIQKK